MASTGSLRLDTPRIPKLGIHKGTGQTRVVIEGRHFYLGKPGAEATRRYRELISGWLTTGELPEHDAHSGGPALVGDLVAAFLEAHEHYYVGPDSKPTGELNNYVHCCKALLRLFGSLPVADFSPKRLKELQRHLAETGICRRFVNEQIRRIKRLFKWGTSEEMVPPGIYQALQTVEGLKRFRSPAKDKPPVQPVPTEDLEATLAQLRPMLSAMVQLQELCGMRVSELLQLKGEDIDRRGKVWIYHPERHKTLHHGKQRTIPIGAQGQALLLPWLLLDPKAYIFSPTRSEADRSATRSANRKSPLTPSQRERHERSKGLDRQRAPGDTFTTAAYRRAIHRACDKAGVPRWSPARLRHNAAERFRREYGIEVTRCILGHADVRTTELYSSFDQTKAVDAMKEIG